MNHCVDCAMDGEGWHQICSDGKPRCYLHKKIFDGLISVYDPRSKRVGVKIVRSRLVKVPVEGKVREQLKTLATKYNPAEVESAAGVKAGTVRRIVTLGYPNMGKENYEKVVAFLNSGKVIQSNKVVIDNEHIKMAKAVSKAYRSIECMEKAGISRDSLVKMRKRGMGKTVYRETAEKLQEAYNRL